MALKTYKLGELIKHAFHHVYATLPETSITGNNGK